MENVKYFASNKHYFRNEKLKYDYCKIHELLYFYYFINNHSAIEYCTVFQLSIIQPRYVYKKTLSIIS